MPATEIARRGWHHVGGCGDNIAWHTEDDTLGVAARGVPPARGGRYEQDPAVTLPPFPLLSIAADRDLYENDTIGFALGSLLRGRNAALDAIERADAAMVHALAR